jgi:hypothetical protein
MMAAKNEGRSENDEGRKAISIRAIIGLLAATSSFYIHNSSLPESPKGN